MSEKSDLVERRQRYIQRQIALDKSAVDVQFEGRAPQGGGAPNRHGMPKLPVGQHVVRNWPHAVQRGVREPDHEPSKLRGL